MGGVGALKGFCQAAFWQKVLRALWQNSDWAVWLTSVWQKASADTIQTAAAQLCGSVARVECLNLGDKERDSLLFICRFVSFQAPQTLLRLYRTTCFLQCSVGNPRDMHGLTSAVRPTGCKWFRWPLHFDNLLLLEPVKSPLYIALCNFSLKHTICSLIVFLLCTSYGFESFQVEEGSLKATWEFL